METILDKSTENGKVQYLVKWAGWTDEFNEWVQYDDIHALEIIKSYERDYPKAAPKRRRGRPRKA